MRHTVDELLLEAARGLGPIVRDHADVAERERRLPRTVLDALSAAGLQRMYLPRSLGGLETDPITYSRVAEEIATFDSAAAWALQAGNQIAWWASRLPNEGAEEIYANGPHVLVAGAFHPPQKAVEVSGGYRVTGRGPLASNIHDADWLLLTGMVLDGDRPRVVDGAPALIQLIVRAREATILDTWHALGMRGTDSNDIVIEDVFVPASRTFPFRPDAEVGPHYRGPLYQFPGVGELVTIFAPVILGIARNAISELRTLALSKTPFGSTRSIRERNVAQAIYAEAEGALRSARALFYDTIAEAWERTLAGVPSTLEQKADLMLAGTHAATSAAKVVESMHGLAGTSGIYATSRLERHFRDAQTLRHHGFISAGRYETVGQVYLDVEPEFALVRF